MMRDWLRRSADRFWNGRYEPPEPPIRSPDPRTWTWQEWIYVIVVVAVFALLAPSGWR